MPRVGPSRDAKHFSVGRRSRLAPAGTQQASVRRDRVSPLWRDRSRLSQAGNGKGRRAKGQPAGKPARGWMRTAYGGASAHEAFGCGPNGHVRPGILRRLLGGGPEEFLKVAQIAAFVSLEGGEEHVKTRGVERSDLTRQ
jgi:hypothetical protein